MTVNFPLIKRSLVKVKLALLVLCAGIFSGSLPTTAAGAALPILWSLQLGNIIESCAAIDANGNLYITSSGTTNYQDFSGGKLVAISPSGKVLWEFKSLCDIKSSPAIGNDGTIYFGGRDRKFYAVSPRGKVEWSFATEGWVDSSPAIATNGTLCFGGWDKNFYALNADGNRKWVFATGGPIDSSPAIAADGTVYFGSHDRKFYALNPDGTQKWVFPTDGAIVSSPALNCDGTIYFTSVDGNLYMLNADGTEKLRMKTGGVRPSSPVIDAEGNIYLGINNIQACLSPAGVKKWSFGYPITDGTAAVGQGGRICFPVTGEGVGKAFVFRATDGELTDFANLGNGTEASVAIGNDGTIYLASGGTLFAMKGNGGLGKSCWPKFRADAAQTGRVNTKPTL
jgi:outer membrane protein assembly factor BamB